MAQYATLKTAINQYITTNGNNEITGAILNNILDAMVDSLGANYGLGGVATPSTNPGTPDQNVFYLAFEAGTYTNFNNTVLPAGISTLMWNGSWTAQTWYTIDAKPTYNSNNFVKSGGVYEELALGAVYDVTAHNSGATFASLSALLSNANLNTLIPTSVRKGGMSIKFVQSSDNKYVQYRLMSNTWSTNVSNWQGVDDEPILGSENLVKSGGVANKISNFCQYTLVIDSGLLWNDLVSTYASNTAYSNSKIVEQYLNNGNKLDIKYLLLKPYSGDTSVDIYSLTINSENTLVNNGKVEKIILKQEWLDETLGANVYKIPFEKTISYIPAVVRFYHLSTQYGNGYCANGNTVAQALANKNAIGFGIIYANKDIKEKIEELEEKLDEELYIDTSVDAGISWGDITSFYNSGVTYTNSAIVKAYIEEGKRLLVKEILYKARANETYIALKKFGINENNTLVYKGDAGSIRLLSEWLDSSLGTNVYRIPFNKTIDYIPAIATFYFLSTPNGNGFCIAGQTVEAAISNTNAIALGIVYKIAIKEELGKIKEELNISKTSLWKNKKIAFIGDSITVWSNNYVSKYTLLTGCNSVNLGESGTLLVSGSAEIYNAEISLDMSLPTDTAQNRTMEKRVKLNGYIPNDVDAIVVLGGINDFRVSIAEKGALTDGANISLFTFYAGLHRMFRYLANTYYNKPVVIMTPMHNNEADAKSEVTVANDGTITFNQNPNSNMTLKDYVNAIKDVAQFYSMQVIDLYSYSGLCPLLPNQRQNHYYTDADGLHPAGGGAMKIARYMYDEMESIYNAYYK